MTESPVSYGAGLGTREEQAPHTSEGWHAGKHREKTECLSNTSAIVGYFLVV